MRMFLLSLPILIAAAFFLVATPTTAQSTKAGGIAGTVVTGDGVPVPDVVITLADTAQSRVSDAAGRFRFSRVPAGSYELRFSFRDEVVIERNVRVVAGEITALERSVDWRLSFADALTVTSVSRRAERIVEAPAAVTVLDEREIARQSSSGQLPKLLEFTPGVDVTQSGVYWFNFNTRAFNSSLNRRVQVLIDGRDPSIPFLGAQEWGAISFPLDDLERVELVRGPGSALYGADAFNGVLNLTTKAPRDSRGIMLRLTGGELDTGKVDFRFAGSLGGDSYLKILGGWTESEDFVRSRTESVEYSTPCDFVGQFDCVPLEALAPVQDKNEIFFGGLRYDKYLANGHVLTAEAGTGETEGITAVTTTGRVQLVQSDRPWARFNYNAPRFNFQASRSERDLDELTPLATGIPLYLDSSRVQFEFQANTPFADDRGFLVGGVSYNEEDIDSADPSGVQTLMFSRMIDDFQAAFAQVEYDFNDRLKGVLAARYDESSLHDGELSPRGSVVFAAADRHTLRFSYSEAFQVPNHVEFFVVAPIDFPVELSFAESICAEEGLSCGFEAVPVLAVGNESLVNEEIESFEIGYSGVLGDKLFISVDAYDNRIENFITDLIGFVNGRLGRINPNFPSYVPPAGLSPDGAAELLDTLEEALPPDLFEILSNDPSGAPIFTALSFTNFGRVDVRGFEVFLNYRIDSQWSFDASYTFADFDIQDQLEEDPILPNTAENKFTLGLSYVGDRFDASIKYRYTEGFDWASGVFGGPIESYDVVHLYANYLVNDRLSVGLDVSNLFDNEHYEIFAGDLLERRALGHVTLRW